MPGHLEAPQRMRWIDPGLGGPPSSAASEWCDKDCDSVQKAMGL